MDAYCIHAATNGGKGAGVKAAQACGFADPVGAASKMLRRANVAAAIRARMAQAAEAAGVTEEAVLRRLARVAFADATRLFAEDGTLLPVSRWPQELRDVIVSLETSSETDARYGTDAEGRATRDVLETRTVVRKVRLPDRIRALELLGKHLGMFADRVKHEFTADGVRQVYLADGTALTPAAAGLPATRPN